MGLKVGDKVRIIDKKHVIDGHDFDIGIITKIASQDVAVWGYYYPKQIVVKNIDDSTVWFFNEDEVELISNFKQMGIKEKFLMSFKKEPEKSFSKAGITDSDDLLTDTGKEIFLAWLLKNNGEKFKTEVVDELLKEDKE